MLQLYYYHSSQNILAWAVSGIMLIEVKTPESTAGNLMPSFSLRCFAFPSHCCQHLRHRTQPLYLRYLTSEANTELYCLDFQHNCSGVRGRNRLKRERTKTGRVSGTPDTLCWGERAQAQGRVSAFLLPWTIQTERLLGGKPACEKDDAFSRFLLKTKLK